VENDRLVQVPCRERCFQDAAIASSCTEPRPISASGRSLEGDSGMNGSLMTANEVADLLGVPASWVYEQSRRGRIPTVTLGRYRRYRREAIEAWVTQLEASARGARTYTSPTR
jgi:excisionase family DNA binding protein